MVSNLKAYLDAYNMAEIGTDGYQNAFTEVKGDNASGSLYTGKCTNGGTATDMSLAQGSVADGNFDAAVDYVLGWGSGTLETVAEVEAWGTNSVTEGNNVCALVCAKMKHWSLDLNNLPYEYTAVAGVLTRENIGASTLDNTYCMGFEIDVSGVGGTDEIECKYYYDAISTGNTD
jgi:hypothetical protein